MVFSTSGISLTIGPTARTTAAGLMLAVGRY